MEKYFKKKNADFELTDFVIVFGVRVPREKKLLSKNVP